MDSDVENPWVVLNSYSSEGEGRVVESFLRSQGLEAQLLDTHLLPSTGPGHKVGMRLLVRTDQLAHAQKSLERAQLQLQPEILESPKPVAKYEKWLVIFLILTALLSWILTRF